MAIRINRRVLGGGAIAAIVLAFALWPQAIEIDTAGVERGPMQVTIDEEGTTRVRERFVVSAPVAGRIERIELEPGDRVVRGKTVVATLTPAASPLLDVRTHAELTAAVSAASAAVGQAQAERQRVTAVRARAQSTVERLAKLLKTGAISEDELEAAQTTARSAEEAVRSAEFAVARAEHELQLARARLRPSTPGGGVVTVTAPVDGVVLKRLRESASVVPVGEPLLEIGDPASLEIVADLLSTDAVRVQRGADVIVERWGGSAPLEGRVRLVEPSGFMKISALGVEEQRVNVIVDLLAPPAQRKSLGDGFRVEARIVIAQAENVLKTPTSALFRVGEDWAVFRVENGVARQRIVKLGLQNGLEAEVVEGLEEGDLVVTHPGDNIVDGVAVKAR